MFKQIASIAAAALTLSTSLPAMANSPTELDGALYNLIVTTTLANEGFEAMANVVAESEAIDRNTYDLICRNLSAVGPSNYLSNRQNVMIEFGLGVYEGSNRSITYEQAGAIGAAAVLAAEEMGCKHLSWSYIQYLQR